VLTRVAQEGEYAEENEDYHFFIDSFELNAKKNGGKL